MSTDAAKRFLTEVRERADKVLADSHTDDNAKRVIRDLLQVGDNFAQLMEQSMGQSADVRVVRKKLDFAKAEYRELEEKLTDFKKKLIALATEIEIINVEAGQILKRQGSASGTSTESAAIERIKSAAQRIIKAVGEIIASK